MPPPPCVLRSPRSPGDVRPVGGERAAVGPMGSAHPPAHSVSRNDEAPGRAGSAPAPPPPAIPSTRGPDRVLGLCGAVLAVTASLPSLPGRPVFGPQVTCPTSVAGTRPQAILGASSVHPSDCPSPQVVLKRVSRTDKDRGTAGTEYLVTETTEPWASPASLTGTLSRGLLALTESTARNVSTSKVQPGRRSPRCPFAGRMNPNLVSVSPHYL